MAPPAGHKGCLKLGGLQGPKMMTILVLALLLVSMAPLVSSQQTPRVTHAYLHTTKRQSTYRATTKMDTTPKVTYPAPTGQATPTPILPHTGPATPAPPSTTTIIIPPGQVFGNLTGEHVCPRPKVDHRYSWKHLTFDCDRKEHVQCWTCSGTECTGRVNATHCIKTLQGECTADVYQYEPVTIFVTVCCDGYQREGTVCVESVECKDNNGGCQHICRSKKTAGFHCECFAGYHLNGSRCEDFDECTVKNGGCSDECINTVGSFYCKCDPGRQLASPFRCEDHNPCLSQESSGCDHFCVKAEQGRYYCECRPGYRLSEGHLCKDIDECAQPYNPCTYKCENLEGSFRCRCPKDQVLKLDNKTCISLGRNPQGASDLEGEKNAIDILSSPAMIGGLAALGGLLLLVTCVWVICCYVRGICCCQESSSDRPRNRRQKPEDVQAIVVQYSNRNKEEESQNGYNNRNYEPYESQPVDEYNTHARTPNGLSIKEEMDGDIHIIPDFSHRGDSGGGRSEVSVPNGYNNRRQGVALPGLT